MAEILAQRRAKEAIAFSTLPLKVDSSVATWLKDTPTAQADLKAALQKAKKQDGEAQYQTRTKQDDDWLWLSVVQGSKAINVSWDFG